MNETELQELEDKVLKDVVEDADIQHAYLSEQLKDLIKQRSIFAAQFRMWKHMRDDTRLQNAAKSLREVKGLIEYIEKELGK